MTPTQPFFLRQTSQVELPALLVVYQACQDFLALGPQPQASAKMVQEDLRHSAEQGGVFYGIYNQQGRMIGVVDYIPGGFEGNPHHAFLSLLMIGQPFRSQGLGHSVVEQVEAEIRQNPAVYAILSAVQTNNPAAIRFWQRQGYQITSGPVENPDGTTVFYLWKAID